MSVLPAGASVDYTVTWLEMTHRPLHPRPSIPAGKPAALLLAEHPPAWFFLSLYDAVGRDSFAHSLAALAPWIHVAVLEKSSIVRTIPEAIAAFDDSPNIIWLTGPSKTADVEGILIEGVHGPGEQIALLV